MKKLLLPLISILSFGIIFSGCEKLDTSEPIIIAPDFINYVTTVKFVSDISAGAVGVVDASMDNTVVNITGPDAAKVYNLQGKQEFKIVGGAVQLMLDPNAKFSSVTEYNVNIVVEPKGFVKRIIPVVFRKEIQTSTMVIAMLNLTDLPVGVAVATKTATINASTGLAAPISIEAKTSDASSVSTKVTVPAGVQIKDASGNNLSGALEARVISFDDSNDMNKFFPGGLVQKNVILENGQVGNAEFKPAGFVSVTMTAGGSAVKSFGGTGITIDINLGKDSFNKTANRPYIAGDKIDIFSYDTTTGVWKYQSNETIQKNTDNSLYVSFKTTHLSYYGAGEFESIPTSTSCTVDYFFNWDTSIRKNLILEIEYSNGASLGLTVSDINKDQAIPFPLFGEGGIVDIKVVDFSNGDIVYIEDLFSLPCGQSKRIQLNLKPLNEVVTLRYGNFCPKKGITFVPPVGVRVDYKEQGTNDYRTLHTVDATNRLNKFITTNLLQVGKTYDFKVTFGNLVRTRTQAITSNDMMFDNVLLESTCNQL